MTTYWLDAVPQPPNMPRASLNGHDTEAAQPRGCMALRISKLPGPLGSAGNAVVRRLSGTGNESPSFKFKLLPMLQVRLHGAGMVLGPFV